LFGQGAVVVQDRFETWPVLRSKPAPKAHGRSISIFINNMQCHLTTVDVYEDGSINCWGFVDREIFRRKVQARWVVASPKPNQSLSVHNFGFTGMADGTWLQSSESIVTEVESILRTLNPEMRNLVDMEGSETELRGKVRYAKMGLPDGKAYRVDATSGQTILADSVPVLRRAAGYAEFELTRLFAFADGRLRVGTSGNAFEPSDLNAMFDSGEIANQVPADTCVKLSGLGQFRTVAQFGGVSNGDRIAEVNDLIGVLQGKPSLLSRCRAAYADYKRSPCVEAAELLRITYEAVPTHLRMYCGDMDTRDTEIRYILNHRSGDKPA
jgi:hypothetical protein